MDGRLAHFIHETLIKGLPLRTSMPSFRFAGEGVDSEWLFLKVANERCKKATVVRPRMEINSVKCHGNRSGAVKLTPPPALAFARCFCNAPFPGQRYRRSNAQDMCYQCRPVCAERVRVRSVWILHIFNPRDIQNRASRSCNATMLRSRAMNPGIKF